jgi:psp operon transcriptional activator
VITLPPLRRREGDVPVLAEHYGRRMASELGWAGWPGFTREASDALEAHAWPGNIRELRNVVERAVYRWDDPDRPIGEIVFDPFDSPWQPAPAGGAPTAAITAAQDHSAVIDLRAAVEAHERGILEHHLARHRYNQRRTAAALGLSYDQLRHCLKKHGLLERPAG